MIKEQAYRVIQGYGTLGKKHPFVCYEHPLTAHVGSKLVVLMTDYNNNSNHTFNTLHIVPRTAVREIVTINQVELKDIKVGDRCMSAIDTPGIITYVDDIVKGRDRGCISIQWSNGNITTSTYELADCPWMTFVEYLGH